MTASISVSSLTLNDGSEIPIPEKSVVLLVGPNNSGKSQALRDISQLATSTVAPGVVISTARFTHMGSSEELLSQFTADKTVAQIHPIGNQVRLSDVYAVNIEDALAWWGDDRKHQIASYFILHANTVNRLNASDPTPADNLLYNSPSHPLHILYRQPQLEKELDRISRNVLGPGVILDAWTGGSQWALRLGEVEPPSSFRPDEDYLDRLQSLPLLHNQGDGVRSMMGLLLNLLTGHQTISLIDEPEAFLHPPQASFLAKLISEDSTNQGRTAFLSTHSSDIVHGTLEGPSPTTVVRLVRQGEKNHAAVLDNEAVKRLWDDPLLRYSNLLEGLFTDAVIVCESDADCKFFASIRDTLEPETLGTRHPDVLFTHCGGKHRMHVGIQALRAASVPVVALGDFDVLNDWETLSRLITAAGGNPAEFETDWRILNSALTSKERTPSVAGMQEAVVKAFNGMKQVTDKSLEPVREALKIENGWSRVKNGGLADVPKGDAYNAAKRLLEQLRSIQVHLVPVGEMEDLVPGVGGHGPGWVGDVLEQGLHKSTETDAARKFVESMLASISGLSGSAA